MPLSDQPNSNSQSIETLLEDFISGTSRKKRSLIKDIEARSSEIISLGIVALKPFSQNGDEWAAGWILQVINKTGPKALEKFLQSDSICWFSQDSLVEIDYSSLQINLIEQNFEEADRFTSLCLRKLAGSKAEERGYVYFSEVGSMSSVDLTTIDRLWVAYSQGRFGFSIQSKLLEALNGRYDRLWSRIGWKIDGIWTRYPNSFTWSLQAPEGHMPLVNQLRGVRLMDALITHPALIARRNLLK